MGEFSITHILIIAVVFLVFFGPSRLPGLGKSIGQAIKGFKQGLNEIDAEAKAVEEPTPEQIQSKSQAQNTQQQSQTQKDKQNT
jgi:sec-independent protein translocase protein TatA